MEKILVSIVEDIPEIREGLRFMINQTRDFSCRDIYDNAGDAYKGLLNNPPQLAIMDISLPDGTGLDCIRKLRAAGSAILFMVFTIYEDSDQVFEALAAGANGYLLKNATPEKITEALKDLYDGGSPMSASIARKVVNSFRASDEQNKLSAREAEVLNLLAKGFLYKEIAAQLFVSTGTIRQHIHHIYEKLHVQNRTEAINRVFGKRG
ncbi:response regulator transcription factor [Mucilaginibacter pocheonensis]|uniref:DNA-binding NarL/FixJ family response regulator n=1 Tax=Mucilaginibacter pocheonensis TaxID=398050 RepID=A0ABU1TFW3_9SPHI|nr:response regulator transcription factor [Mucilaginibacter pocheonensis]MDR6944134.1 DNA-binding NarL/FixJ family response regulator [Mucilaginibacter pocheonensis]